MTTGTQPRRATPIAVAIVDDHPAIVASIATTVDAADDMQVVWTASTYDGAIGRIDDTRPNNPLDVVLLDIQLDGGAEGLRLLEHLTERRPDAAQRPGVIVLSGFEQSSLVRAVFERGASGYLVKTASLSEVLDAIRVVAAGGTVFTATAVRSVRSAPRRPSQRELQVIGLISAGASNAEAGHVLGVSEKTIESHLRRLFDRYGLLSRTELAVLAMQEGWVAGAQPFA